VSMLVANQALSFTLPQKAKPFVNRMGAQMNYRVAIDANGSVSNNCMSDAATLLALIMPLRHGALWRTGHSMCFCH
jgi:hypothetical protein